MQNNMKKYLSIAVLLLLGILIVGITLPALAADKSSVPAEQQLQQKNAARDQNFEPNAYRAQTAVTALAELSGKDVEEIRAARQAGKSLLQIAQECGVDDEALVEKITAQNQARLQSRLEEGSITQSQYDSCMNNMQSRIQATLERSNAGPMNGGKGHSYRQGQCNGQGQGYGYGRDQVKGQGRACPGVCPYGNK